MAHFSTIAYGNFVKIFVRRPHRATNIENVTNKPLQLRNGLTRPGTHSRSPQSTLELVTMAFEGNRGKDPNYVLRRRSSRLSDDGHVHIYGGL